ncbi:unnamed protein product [Symbiodinium natans]|uniref:STAS domain-containing protein n=1 Tax=Symbiodinium natans TaxID=878477 RepID=A0A812UC28_9DINO|nr:unnamed protein product [Symbiodinium natans]
MGVREALGGIVSASMVFSSSDIPEISSMLQFGISMTLYTMSVGVLWYAIFGRLQYGYGTQQDLICILQAQLAVKAALRLEATPEKIPATVFAIICTSSILSGLVSILFGKLRWATSMLMIPKPVVSGFLGAIGVVVLQAGLKTASGVRFHHFWPDVGWVEFCSSKDRVLQVTCMMLHFACIRQGPSVCASLVDADHSQRRQDAVKKYAALVCQLAPLLLFYIVVMCLGMNMESLAEHGWTYPSNGSEGAMSIWSTYSFSDVDLLTVREICVSLDIVALVAMAILCTMLGALAITGRYPTGPAGDPSPDDPLDFNAELTTVGAASLFLGLTGGNLIFHKFSVIQLREDGGTHRVAVLTIALVAGCLFVFGFPIGSVVPKWFLGGLFMNTGWSFLKKTLLSYQHMSTFKWRGLHIVSMQYGISTCCVLMALYFSPTTAIMAGLCLSILLFVWDGMSTSPVSSVVDGQHVVSRTKRPWWEMNVLAAEGDRVRLLYLQGQLFFGSMLQLTSSLEAAASDHRIEFVILSYARVPLMDPSAAENIRAAQEKISKFGCNVLHCRTNEQVFGALCAAGAIQRPSKDFLLRIQNNQWSFVSESLEYLDPETPNNDTHPDAFFHETDCLDYCDEYLVRNFSYDLLAPSPPLEDYMREYRAVVEGSQSRLSEAAFEIMSLGSTA